MKYHMNDGRIEALCGVKKARNLMSSLSMVNCDRCLRIATAKLTPAQRKLVLGTRAAALKLSRRFADLRDAADRAKKRMDLEFKRLFAIERELDL